MKYRTIWSAILRKTCRISKSCPIRTKIKIYFNTASNPIPPRDPINNNSIKDVTKTKK